ncbi:hypothetical protein ACJX0J_017354, partial [Zea mays]
TNNDFYAFPYLRRDMLHLTDIILFFGMLILFDNYTLLLVALLVADISSFILLLLFLVALLVALDLYALLVDELM